MNMTTSPKNADYVSYPLMSSIRRPSPVLLLAVLILNLSACSENQQLADYAPDQLGPFDVGHTSLVATDAERGDRALPVDLWYPVDPGEGNDAPITIYPLAEGVGLDSEVAREDAPATAETGLSLLVFSHGYGGINTQSVKLMEALASHGFVVASPEHIGNSQASPGDDFDTAAGNRVPDVSFVIDAMFERGRNVADPLYGRLDEAQVGVIGHSFGGMTAIGVKSGWAGAEPDPRVAAIVPISAVIDGGLQGDDRSGSNAGFSAEQLARVQVPAMLIGGTEDVSVPIANNQIAFEQMTQAPVVYKADIIGATHTHFANICDIGNMLIDSGIRENMWPAIGAGALVAPYNATCTEEAFSIEEATRLLNLYAVAFFRLHLRGDGEYAGYLDKDYAAKESAVDFSKR
jgi:predicted dienelactone hydrolase